MANASNGEFQDEISEDTQGFTGVVWETIGAVWSWPRAIIHINGFWVIEIADKGQMLVSDANLVERIPGELSEHLAKYIAVEFLENGFVG